jgi:hypothetical protein
MTTPPGEPTAPVKPAVRGRGDEPPPDPPRELPRAQTDARSFEHEGRSWLARIGGKGAYGTGSYGLGLVEAIHFYAAEQPERPAREALLARGRFETLYEEELVALLARATPVAGPAGR